MSSDAQVPAARSPESRPESKISGKAVYLGDDASEKGGGSRGSRGQATAVGVGSWSLLHGVGGLEASVELKPE